MRMSTGQRLVEAMVGLGKDSTTQCRSCLVVLVCGTQSVQKCVRDAQQSCCHIPGTEILEVAVWKP